MNILKTMVFLNNFMKKPTFNYIEKYKTKNGNFIYVFKNAQNKIQEILVEPEYIKNFETTFEINNN